MTPAEAVAAAKEQAAETDAVVFVGEKYLGDTWGICVSTDRAHIAVHPDGALIPLSRHGIYVMDRDKIQ